MTLDSAGILEAGQNGAGSLSVGGLTFSDTATVNIPARLRNMSAPAAAAINDTGALIVDGGGTGSIVINLPTGSVANGTYRLIGYTGTIGGGGSGFGAFTLGTQPAIGGPAKRSSLSTSAEEIDLVIAGDTPVWTGAFSSEWSTATIPSPKNWTLAVAGTPTDFIAGDESNSTLRRPTKSSIFRKPTSLPAAPASTAAITRSNRRRERSASRAIAHVVDQRRLAANHQREQLHRRHHAQRRQIAFASGGLCSTGAITFAGDSTLQWASGNADDLSGRLVVNDGVAATLDTQDNNITFAGASAGDPAASRKSAPARCGSMETAPSPAA